MKKIFSTYCLAAITLLLAACSQDMDMDTNSGYITLKVNTLESTQNPGTRTDAPAGYAPKQLHVDIVDATGQTVKSTNDFEYDTEFQSNIQLPAGDYTIRAYSNGWDGSGSGFDVPYYYGSTSVTVQPKNLSTARVTCRLANVKVTVEYDATFASNFASAQSVVSSEISGTNPLTFVMGETTRSGYFPVGNLNTLLTVVNKGGETHTKSKEITGVRARDHYILKYKMADSGNLGDGSEGGIKVTIDESTNTYTYEFQVPTKSSTAFTMRAANAWSTFAYLNASIDAKTEKFDQSGLTLQWKKAGDTDWTSIAASALTIDASDNISYKLTGLEPETDYECRVHYMEGDNEVNSTTVTFTTEAQTELYNGGFENWWMDGKVAYATEEGVSYWDTSNKGAASFGGSNTTETTEVVHGGTKAAKLESKYIVIKFAAASLYTGQFVQLVGTKGAKLKWGVPFSDRPTALKGYMQYTPANVDRVGSNLPASAPAKGEPDQCGMYCALLSEQLNVDNTDIAGTFPNWETDSRVIAYGALLDNENVNSNGTWKEVNIPLVYHNLVQKPTHLLIVFSASKYGDYFHGGTGSTLYLDDFSLEYGDNPAVQ